MAQEKYYFANENSPIKDFPNEKIEQILEDYCNYIKFDDIRLSFPEINKSSFYTQLPFTLSEEKCEHCSTLIYYKYKHNNYTALHLADKLCLNCRHENSGNCDCKICASERKIKQEEKRNVLDKIWSEFYDKFYNLNYTLDDLTIFDEIHLASIIQRFYNEYQNSLYFSKSPNRRFDHFHPFQSNLLPQDYAVIKLLIDRKILIPTKDYIENRSYNTPFETLPNVDAHNVHWTINIAVDKIKKEFYDAQQLYSELNSKQYSIEEKKLLYNEVYSSEIGQYIHSLSKKYIGIYINEMIVDYAVELLLPRLPLSKAFGLIFYSMSSTMRYKASYNTNEQKLNSHFKNRISESILKNEFNKTLKDFNRPNDIELCFFSEYILDEILNQRSAYFYLPIDKIIPDVEVPDLETEH